LTLNEQLEAGDWSNGLYGALFTLFAAVALLLAAVGLYAVVAHAVGRRTQEIGVRMAMGATSLDVLRLVLKQGLAPVGLGLAIGLIGSLGVTPVLRSLLVRVSPADPLTLIGASIVLVAAGVLGCLIPARRAGRVDPAVPLRHE
jgi:putative ABC transport system permease protein